MTADCYSDKLTTTSTSTSFIKYLFTEQNEQITSSPASSSTGGRWKCSTGKCGTKMQGWKKQVWKANQLHVVWFIHSYLMQHN